MRLFLLLVPFMLPQAEAVTLGVNTTIQIHGLLLAECESLDNSTFDVRTAHNACVARIETKDCRYEALEDYCECYMKGLSIQQGTCTAYEFDDPGQWWLN